MVEEATVALLGNVRPLRRLASPAPAAPRSGFPVRLVGVAIASAFAGYLLARASRAGCKREPRA